MKLTDAGKFFFKDLIKLLLLDTICTHYIIKIIQYSTNDFPNFVDKFSFLITWFLTSVTLVLTMLYNLFLIGDNWQSWKTEKFFERKPK